VSIDYAEIKIDHLVEYSDDEGYLTVGRQKGLMFIFRIENDQRAFFFHGQKGNWQEIFDGERQMLISRILVERFSVPVFHISGKMISQESIC